ncbi:MAG: EamA family transporter [Bacteroidales bacterium]|nr:EamA family transporter [Bacteroidales bacterium]
MSGIRTLGDNKAVIYLLSVLAILLWGMSYIWSDSLISQEVPIFYFVPLRILIAGLILLLFNLLSCNFKPIARKDLWKFMLLSLFEPLVYFLCETYGIKETGSPTISAMIIASVPIVSVIAGCTLFKEKVTFVNVLGILVTLAGILLVLSSQGEDCKGGNFVLGLVLLVLAVFAEVGHASMTKFLSGDYKPQVIAMYQFLIGSVYLLPFFIFKGLDGFEARYLSWQVLRPILFLALLCSSLAFSLWAMTIKKLGVAKSSVFLATMCIATALVAELIGREHMVLIQWLGIGVAVLGIILSQMSACNREGQGSR